MVTHGNVSRALGAFVDDGDMVDLDARIKVHRARALPWHLGGELLYRLGLAACPISTGSNRRFELPPVLLDLQPMWSSVSTPPLPIIWSPAGVGLRRRGPPGAGRRRLRLELSPRLGRGQATRRERGLVQEADLISVATQGIADNLVERYAIDPAKIHLTQNRYWQEVEGDIGYPRREKIRIVYAGAISAAQGLEVLPQALELLAQRQPGSPLASKRLSTARIIFICKKNCSRPSIAECATAVSWELARFQPPYWRPTSAFCPSLQTPMPMPYRANCTNISPTPVRCWRRCHRAAPDGSSKGSDLAWLPAVAVLNSWPIDWSRWPATVAYSSTGIW